MTFHQTIQRLCESVREAYGLFPAYRRRDDLRKVPAQGIALWVSPSKRRTPAWYAGAESHATPRILIFWPVFLRNAVTPGSLQLPAWQLVNQLLPVFEHFDAVLVHLIKTVTLEQILENNDSEPVQQLRKHLRNVTANLQFRRTIAPMFIDAVKPIRDRRTEEALRACPSGKHYATLNLRCEQCEGFEWTLYGVNYLWPDAIDEIKRVQLKLNIPTKINGTLPYVGYGDWDKELRWMLSCLSPEEGAVITNDGKLLVNFGRVAAQAHYLERDSLLRTFEGDEWHRGVLAREAALETLINVVAQERDTPLVDMAAAQGWPVKDVLRTPFELFDVTKILGRFARNNQLKRAKRVRHVVPPPRQTVVTLEYKDPDNISHLIRCFRRTRRNQRLNYYSVPWLKDVAPFKKEYTYLLDGEHFWTLHGFTNQPKPDEARKTLEYFEVWLAKTDSTLTEREFRQLVYDQQLVKRLQKIATGKRKQLALFSRLEDKAISEFAAQRTPGSFTPSEKGALLSALPGRKWLGIKRRYEQLAFMYALANGYTAYLASGWKTNNFRKREFRWKKRGVAA